jgi:hypothetical protein
MEKLQKNYKNGAKSGLLLSIIFLLSGFFVGIFSSIIPAMTLVAIGMCFFGMFVVYGTINEDLIKLKNGVTE